MRKRDILLRSRTSRSSLRVSVFTITVLELYWLRLIHPLFCFCCLAVLQAMRDDSDKVPGLLTDYILKGELFHVCFIEVRDMMCCQCPHCQSCLTEAKGSVTSGTFPRVFPPEGSGSTISAEHFSSVEYLQYFYLILTTHAGVLKVTAKHNLDSWLQQSTIFFYMWRSWKIICK